VTGWTIGVSKEGKEEFTLCQNRLLGSFQWVRRPVREVDHSPSSSFVVTNEWSYTSAPIICLHDVDRGNFYHFFFFSPFDNNL
jgi:hypothetical protein